jgi:hypothetical protein
MATTKQMLVLANSIKHWPGVCVAGREFRLTGSQHSLGPWIRPVSSHGEGELSPNECRLMSGLQPRVMDLIEVSLDRHVADPLQPENWLIDGGTPWRASKAKFEIPSLNALLETPATLWLQTGENTDRVKASYLHQNPPGQSLYLVRVEDLRARFEWYEWDGRYRQRRRAMFSYNGVGYDFSITDPIFSERHRAQFPAKGSPANSFPVVSERGCHVCVSLAPEFNGYHYKVVATVFE